MPSFTVTLPNLEQNGPVIDIQVAVGADFEQALQRENQSAPTPVRARALIDTGAQATVIREDIAEKLQLRAVGVAKVLTPYTDVPAAYPRYEVRILLPNYVRAQTIGIAAPLRGQNIQCLIGRDVLCHGVLVYNGYAETFTLSF